MLAASPAPFERASEWAADPGTEEKTEAARLNELDAAAWESFYLEHRRVVMAVVASYTGYGPGLDDVTQEVFVTAVSLVRSCSVELRGDRSGLRAWLLAIAQRVGLAESRKQTRSRARMVEQDWESFPARSSDPVLLETVKRAYRLLAELPYRLRTPWVLRNLEGMTIEDVALSIGMSMATTKRRLGRADERFRRLAMHDPLLRDYLQTTGSP